LKKGDLGGFLSGYRNPPCPPLEKRGKILAFIGGFPVKGKSSYL
jgi:hypothetical protein